MRRGRGEQPRDAAPAAGVRAHVAAERLRAASQPAQQHGAARRAAAAGALGEELGPRRGEGDAALGQRHDAVAQRDAAAVEQARELLVEAELVQRRGDARAKLVARRAHAAALAGVGLARRRRAEERLAEHRRRQVQRLQHELRRRRVLPAAHRRGRPGLGAAARVAACPTARASASRSSAHASSPSVAE